MTIVPQVERARKVFVGIDVHLRSYAVTVFEANREIAQWSTPAEPEPFAQALIRKYPGCEITSVYEAGFSGFVLHRALESVGIKNLVVHASAVAVSCGDRVKTDKRDSKKLAQHLAAGLIVGIRIPTEEEEFKRQLTRTREQLVRARVSIMNQTRRRLVHFGLLTKYEGVLQVKHIKELLNARNSDELNLSVESQVRVWEALTQEIKTLESLMREQGNKCQLHELYLSVPGIGRIASRILANELGDMSQFRNEKALFKFVGLTPTERSSGDKIRRGPITRQGNSYLRKVLVEASWVAIRHDASLRDFYLRLVVRLGAQKAIVAVARKLIGRIRAIVRRGVVYREEVLESDRVA